MENELKYPDPSPRATYNNLIGAARSEGLVLFVGAGINTKKCPIWTDLVASLFSEALDSGIFGRLTERDRSNLAEWVQNEHGLNYEEIAELTKFAFGRANDKKLKKVLYKGAGQQSDLLTAVAELCASDQRIVRAVVTYNFDDYLEQEVERVSRERESQVSEHKPLRIFVHYADRTREYSSTGDPPKAQDERDPTNQPLRLYHVHGYIPRQDLRESEQSREVIFSQEEYYLNMLRPHSWQTTTQLHFLRNYNCLFVGVSLTDINMSRLLSYSRDTCERQKRQTRWTITAEEAIVRSGKEEGKHDGKDDSKQQRACHKSPHAMAVALRIRATVLDKLGISLIVAGEKFERIPAVLRKMREACESTTTK
jgi:hypothetical protein